MVEDENAEKWPDMEVVEAPEVSEEEATSGTAEDSNDSAPTEMEWDLTKKEAKNYYCLPEGTLAVCEVQERQNPHHKGWTPMKLYRKSELEERAYKRYGGKEGLEAERNKRRDRKFAKDMEEARKVFE